MPERVGIIAHDLVGAVEGSVSFTRHGLVPEVVLEEKTSQNIAVVSTTTMSKIASSHEAYLRTKKAIRNFQGRYLYLYENLHLMGNISADIKATFDERQPEKLIFCTAWPERNSRIIGSRAFYGDVPSDRSIRAGDPLSPILESYIPSIANKYTGFTSKRITTDEVEQGSDYLAELIAKSSERIIICDATKQFHLSSIAKAIMHDPQSWVACGSSGLIQNISPLLGYSKHDYTLKPLPQNKPVLLVVGSLNNVASVQLATAAEKDMVYPVMVEPLELWSKKERERKIFELAKEASHQICRGKNVAITSTVSRFVSQLKRTTAYLLARIAEIVIDEHGLQTLYLTGADTSYAVCKTLEINTMEVKGRIAKVFSPNIVKGYTSNGKEYWICIKSGVAGDEMTMVQALRFLRSR